MDARRLNMAQLLAYRRAMSRLSVAKQELETKQTASRSEHESASISHRDASIALLNASLWSQEQRDPITAQVSSVCWFGNHGIEVASRLSITRSNNTGKMQDFNSLWSYFKACEWDKTLSRLPCEAKLLVFTRAIELGGVKLSEDSWKRITMGLLLAQQVGNRNVLHMSACDKHDKMAQLKAEFKKQLRRHRKNSLLPVTLYDLPAHPAEFMYNNPELYHTVFCDALPV